jgi:hypothetical protein
MTRSAGVAALAVLLVVVLAGCGTAIAPTASPVIAAPATFPGTVTAPPGTPLGAPTLPPGQTPSPTGCGPGIQVEGPWPSDRLVAVDAVTTDVGGEEVQFRFAPASAPGHASTIRIRETTGPSTNAASGAPVQIGGSMFMEVHLEGLLLADAQGAPTLQTPLELRPNLIRVRHVVATDASEGVMTWVIGSDVTCVGLRTEPANGLVALVYSIAVP